MLEEKDSAAKNEKESPEQIKETPQADETFGNDDKKSNKSKN